MKSFLLALMILLSPVIFAIFPSAASADSPPAIDFSQPILDENGKTAQIDPKDEKQGVITLKFVAIHALTGLYDDEKGLASEKKFQRGLLAQKISEAKGPLTLTAENITEIKLVVGKAFGPWVIAQAWPMLDPAEKR